MTKHMISEPTGDHLNIQYDVFHKIFQSQCHYASKIVQSLLTLDCHHNSTAVEMFVKLQGDMPNSNHQYQGFETQNSFTIHV